MSWTNAWLCVSSSKKSWGQITKKSYDSLMTYLSQTYDKVTIVSNYKRIL